MSSALAIATVTSALRNLLMQVTVDMPDAIVTAKPPHKARSGQEHGNQLNLFLYQAAPNAAWQNNDSATKPYDKASESLFLALNLYYFLTAYGRDDEDLLSHRLLGKAMVILHQRKVLHPQELKIPLPGNKLHQQREQIRIAPHALTPEELAKLWSVFQCPYALTVAYQVSVVVISSSSSTLSTLPQPNNAAENLEQNEHQLLSPAIGPELKSLSLPRQTNNLVPGDLFTVHGYALHGDQLQVQFRHLQLHHLKQSTFPVRSDTRELTVQFPSRMDTTTLWAAGFYRISLAIHRVNIPIQYTNALVFAVAPAIQSATLPSKLKLDKQIELKLICHMPIYPDQSIMLIVYDSNKSGLGVESVRAQSLTTVSTELRFWLDTPPTQHTTLILQVDGVNSAPFSSKKLQEVNRQEPISSPVLEVNP